MKRKERNETILKWKPSLNPYISHSLDVLSEFGTITTEISYIPLNEGGENDLFLLTFWLAWIGSIAGIQAGTALVLCVYGGADVAKCKELNKEEMFWRRLTLEVWLELVQKSLNLETAHEINATYFIVECREFKKIDDVKNSLINKYQMKKAITRRITFSRLAGKHCGGFTTWIRKVFSSSWRNSTDWWTLVILELLLWQKIQFVKNKSVTMTTKIMQRIRDFIKLSTVNIVYFNTQCTW